MMMVWIAAMAQIQWVDKDYNFGTWSETEGIRGGKTLLINNTDAPVLIRKVRPTCGCTGVDWPEEPVAPGDTAVISFNYNPKGRPGEFNKTIKVYLNDSTEPEIIHITGTVIGTDSSLIQRYPYKVGPLRLSSLSYDFGELRFGDVRHTFISVYNTDGRDVTPVPLRMQPADNPLPVEVAITPQTVEPGKVQTISVYLNTGRAPMLGRLSAVQTICVGSECIDLTFTADILPAVNSDADLGKAPQCDARPDVVDLGDIRRGKKCKFEFTVTNTGHSVLNVKRIYSRLEGAKVVKYPVRVKPGKSGKVTAEIEPRDYPDDIVSGVIEIITDDPLRPVQTVRFVGKIK